MCVWQETVCWYFRKNLPTCPGIEYHHCSISVHIGPHRNFTRSLKDATVSFFFLYLQKKNGTNNARRKHATWKNQTNATKRTSQIQINKQMPTSCKQWLGKKRKVWSDGETVRETYIIIGHNKQQKKKNKACAPLKKWKNMHSSSFHAWLWSPQLPNYSNRKKGEVGVKLKFAFPSGLAE